MNGIDRIRSIVGNRPKRFETPRREDAERRATHSNALERHRPNYVAGTSESFYYQYDHRGNVAAVSDAGGEIERGYRYDAFGNVVWSFQESGAAGPPPPGGAALDDILFTGKDLDPDTGLYYFNARWYDPQTGTFVSATSSWVFEEAPYVLCESDPM